MIKKFVESLDTETEKEEEEREIKEDKKKKPEQIAAQSLLGSCQIVW